MALSTGDGGSGRRRIDDVRQLQGERRRQALLPQPIDFPQQQEQQQEQQQQQQRQRQHQYEYDVDEMVVQMNHQLGGYHSDANTMASSTISGGGGSGGGGGAPASSTLTKSPATSTRSAQSSRLSTTRKNMMQRRIEMRKKNEERQQQEKMMPRQQQLLQQSQSDAPHSRQPQQSSSNNPSDDGARNENYYSRPVSHQPYQSQQQNYYQGQGVQQQHPDWRDYPNNSDQSQEKVQLQQQHPPPQGRQPQLQNHQYQSQNSQQSHQHPHRAQLQQLQQQTHQSQSQHQYSREQAAQLVLLSPPMLQRTGESRHNEQAIHQYYVMEGGELPIEEDIRDGRVQYSFDSDIPGETNHYQVYNQNELERSGIIRDSRAPAQLQQQQQQQQPAAAASATVNRLKHYGAPSDEWHDKNSPPSGWHGYNISSEGTGFESAAMSEQLRLSGRNQDHQQQQQPPAQYHLQSQQYPRSQSQARRRQPQQQHSGKDARHDTESLHQRQTNAVGHQDPSMRGVSATRPSEYTDHNDEPDEMHQQKQSLLQSHHTQDYQQLHDQNQNQYHSQNQPNWKDISQLYHDDNRQRFYKNQLTSRQQYQERQQQQVVSQYQGHHKQQHPTLQQREQQEPSRLSTLSPMDHLGNRTDHIQRKNKFLPSMPSKSLSPSPSTRNKGHHYLTFASNNDNHSLDEEICPVSEQAHTFDNAAGRAGKIQGQVSRGRSRQPVLHQQHQQEEDTVSVASIRKGWVEKTNILKEQQERQAQQQAQQRRREQRKSIEDRWMNNRRKDTVKSVPPPEKRGYKSQHHDLKAQGYQSEGERRSNSRSERYDGGYQSQDPDAITPKDARRRLWDEHERLRAVLPKNEKFECNNVRGRWPEHKIEFEHSNNGPSSPSQFSGGLASPGNNSGSSLEAGGRFKSKFVHAAALAAQQRLANIDSDDRQRPHYSQQSQWQSQQQHQQQHQPYGESQHQHQPTGQQHQQQHNYTTINTNYSQKGIAVSSHYTDSTAEITADITTIPEGSNGSTSNRGTLQNNSPRMSSNLVARTVTPSPPKRYSRTHNHDSSSTMPPIDEQGVTPSLKIQTDTTSVADLIARINAVSRSNPEEALAAIDSIIKKEGGGYGNVHRNVGGRRSGVGGPAIIAPPEISRNGPYDHHVVEGYRNCVGTPAIMAHQGVSRSGPALVVAPAPSKIARDNSLLGQRHHFSKEFFQDAVPAYEDQNDDDDSLLSSDDSTVSSMTNPTYQSIPIPAQKVAQNKATPSTGVNVKVTRSTVSPITDPTYQSIRPKPRKALPSTASQEPINSVGEHSFIQKSSHSQQLENFPPIKSQKSWNTLKKEYTVLKSSPPIRSFSTEEMNASSNFSPDIEPHDDDTRQQLQQRIPKQSPINLMSTSACVPIPQQRDVFGKTKSWDEEKKLRPFTRTTPAAPNNSRDNHMARDQRTTTEQPAHPQKERKQSRDKFPTQDSAPGDNMNTDPRTVDFPEIMTVVSHAFADVDINLEAAKTTTIDPSMSLKQLRPTQSYKSKGDTVEGPLPHHRQLPSSAECSASLQETISEAFSDVDISFGQETTVSERRKQLEYLSASWLEDKNSRVHERSKGNSESFAGSSRVRESLEKTQATAANQKKKVEPTIRLKGNKNLAQKFARLVNAFE